MAVVNEASGGPGQPAGEIDGPAAWLRLGVALLLGTIGGVGMWSVVVALPAVQAEFGVARGAASLPYTATMLGFAAGGVLMGWIADKRGIVVPVMIGAGAMAAGYSAASMATELWQYIVAQALIGMLGAAACFAPLIADTSQWFRRRRGVAVSIVAAGNYMAGAIWPPVLTYFMEAVGWRQTHLWVGLFCLATMLPLALLLRRRLTAASQAANAAGRLVEAPLSPRPLMALLVVAGIACCVAMSMPQVHIVAYCGDLGYGVARGAEMLSLMLAFGVVSRLVSGWISDHIGGVRTLLIGSVLQGITLLLYVPFDGLISLYIVSALFGLAQGGIVPSYAMIVREYFPAKEAATRVGVVMMATIVGMALGGWMSGAIYDLTGSYRAAFLNGLAWNLLNVSIAVWLVRAPRRPLGMQPA